MMVSWYRVRPVVVRSCGQVQTRYIYPSCQDNAYVFTIILNSVGKDTRAGHRGLEVNPFARACIQQSRLWTNNDITTDKRCCRY